jgi:hypothetical protein
VPAIAEATGAVIKITTGGRTTEAPEYLRARRRPPVLRIAREQMDDARAMLLRFSDAANVRRALKRWTGKGPGELRR